jgi:phage baseplate assembly protein W
MAREVYIGFSTTDVVEPPYRLVDIELVKQDLRNALNTRKGERVMRPTYGTRIFDLLMEPFDETTRDAIIQDVLDVVNMDPRVSITNINVFEMEHVLRVDLELRFQPQDTVDQLYLEYDRRNLEAN